MKYIITIGRRQIERNPELLHMIAELQELDPEYILTNVENPNTERVVAYKMQCFIPAEDLLWLTFKYKYFEKHARAF